MGKVRGYGQFCPVAKAAEIVAERWTPLILRELLCGSSRFGDLQSGLPLISPSMLSQRLKELCDADIVEKVAGAGGGNEYHLTAAGEELRPIIEMLGLWGHRWIRHRIEPEDLDPALLMWDIRRFSDASALDREERTVVQFDLAGVPVEKSRWWLVFDRGEVDLCYKNPGYDVDLWVSAPIRDLIDVWLGYVELQQAIDSRALALEGDAEMVRSFSDWFALSAFARLSRQDYVARRDAARD